MVERENGNPHKRGPETVAEASGRLQNLFQEVSRKHPEELFVWQGALYDIIDQAQIQYNIRSFKEDEIKGKPHSRERFREENRFQRYKDKRVMEKMEDDRYNTSYEKIAKEVLAIEVAFAKGGVPNHLGATLRELRRVKRSVQEL